MDDESEVPTFEEFRQRIGATEPLSARPFPSFRLPPCRLSSLIERAGQPESIRHYPDYSTFHYRVRVGRALIAGVFGPDETISNGEVIEDKPRLTPHACRAVTDGE